MGAQPVGKTGASLFADEEASRAIPLENIARGVEPTEPLSGRGESAAEPDLAALLSPRQDLIARLIRFAYARGVPARTLARPFRKPARLRLLATVSEPLPGSRPAGMALRAGYFLIAGRRLATHDADFTGETLGAPLSAALHRFAWLADLETAGTRDRLTPIAEELLRRWLFANPQIGSGPAWTASFAGHRLLNWLIHAPVLLGGGDRVFRRRMLREIAATADWLDRAVRKPLPAHQAIPAWCAIVAAGLLLPDGKPRRLYGEAGLIAALGDAVGEDGGMLSRSLADQAEAIVLLLRLAACYRSCRLEPPPQIEGLLALLVPPLLSLAHADGSLGSWQGAAPLSARRVRLLREIAAPRAHGLREARGWGFQRLAARQSVLQLDAAPPPTGRHAHGGCASTLALEFSHRDQRLIVNCGGAALAGAMVPAQIANELRASAAHSTLVLGDRNSTAVLGDGRLGAGVQVVTFAREPAGDGTALIAAHDGYAARHGLLHERRVTLRDDGLGLEGLDRLVPQRRKARRGDHAFAIRFHLGAGIAVGHELAVGPGAGGVTLALPDGSYWQFRSPDAPLAIDDSLWVDAGGVPRATYQIVLTGAVGREGGEIGWSLRQMG